MKGEGVGRLYAEMQGRADGSAFDHSRRRTTHGGRSTPGQALAVARGY